MAKFCPTHGKEMTFHEAGVSRTKKNADGSPKSFNASWRCPVQDCKEIVWIKDEDLPAAAQQQGPATNAAPQNNGRPGDHPRKQEMINSLACISTAFEYAGRRGFEDAYAKALAAELFAALERVKDGGALEFTLDADIRF